MREDRTFNRLVCLLTVMGKLELDHLKHEWAYGTASVALFSIAKMNEAVKRIESSGF